MTPPLTFLQRFAQGEEKLGGPQIYLIINSPDFQVGAINDEGSGFSQNDSSYRARQLFQVFGFRSLGILNVKYESPDSYTLTDRQINKV
jgi:hypothetical protein